MTEEEIVGKLKIKKGEKVLDVGGSMKQLSEIRTDTLIDLIHPSESRYNKSKLRAAHFCRLNFELQPLPFKNKQFDVCICSHTIEDLHNPFLILNEMSRVAKRGIVITPSRGRESVFGPINFTNWRTGARRLPGLAHHNWMCEVIKDKLVIVPKNYPLLYSAGLQTTKWMGEDECVYTWKGKIDYLYDKNLDLEFKSLVENYRSFLHRKAKYITRGTAVVFIDNPIRYGYELMKYLLSYGRI